MDEQVKKYNELLAEVKKINDYSIKINSEIEYSRKEYNKLKLLFEEKYGTSDIKELVKIFQEQSQKNTDIIENLDAKVKSVKDSILAKRKELDSLEG